MAGGLAIVDAFILHGTPATREQVGPHLAVVVQHIGMIDYVRIALGVLAAVLVGYALVRWADAGRPDGASDADGAPRMFGDSIVDARTQVDPGRARPGQDHAHPLIRTASFQFIRFG